MSLAESSLIQRQAAGVNTFLFISDILGRLVINAEGNPVGKLSDIKIRLGEPFPKVVSLTVKKRKTKTLLELDWQEVQALDEAVIHLKAEAENKLKPLEVANDEIMLRDELLDKQVVDTYGAKIERVNDVHLLIVNQELRVVHVDFGIRGILRRLGWLGGVDRVMRWLFAYRFEEKMISWKYVQPLLSDSVKRNLKLNVAARKIHEIHPSDLADIIEELDRANRSSIFRSLDLQTAAQTLEEVEDPKLQASLIQSAPVEQASDILGEMAPDEATDLLADLPREHKEQLIEKMEKSSRAVVEELLKFKEGTAGSLMTKDFFSVLKDRTIGEAIEEFRKTTYPLDSVAYIYVTDKENHLLGVSTLRHLITCAKETPLKNLMNSRLVKVDQDDDIKDVSALFQKYKFMSVPVVDKDNILKGIITLKDIMKAAFED